MRGLRVLLLGRPLLEIDGQPLTRLMATKHQALVFYLACQRGPVTRSQLATLLWGELDDAAARANLRVALTRLRRWLPDVLDIDANLVGFAAHESVWVDLHELESAAREPASLPVDRLARVADLYRGPLLDGFDVQGADDFEIWSRQAREGALRAAVAARRHLAHHFEQAGALGDAIEHARAWIAIDEADEHGHCNLMRLLAASGQRIAAIAQYESCRAILTERLGARPSAETYALYCRIHADAPAAGRPAEPVAQPFTHEPARLEKMHGLPPRDAVELIGRETEVATLSEQLRDPACRWVTLIGPGGVGKTRLALAVAEAVQNEFVGGVVFVSGRDLGNADADAAAAAIAQRFGVPQARTSIVWRAVEQRLAGRPTLLVLDNLETLEDARPLLQGLVDALPSVRVLATSRSRVGGAREWLFEMAGLSLHRAADDAAASSAAARLFVHHARRLDTGFDAATQAPAIDHICVLVAGLPLALEMAARGVLISGCNAIAARIAAGTPLEDPDRPRDDRQRSIETVLRDSWSQLPRPAQQAACRLARLPQEFDAGMAAEVAQVNAALLDELRGHSWLSKASGDRLSMHPLQRDFVRRQPDAGAVAEELDESLARHVSAAMVAVPPFADVTADAMRRAGAWQSVSFTAAVIAQAAGHVCTHWDLAKMMPFVDALSAHLCAAGRWPEACTLLHDAAERSGLPMWRRVGWLLREAEMLNEAGAVRRAAQAYQRGLELLGLRGFDSNLLLLRQVPRLTARLVALDGWPDSRADHQAFSRLLVRSLSFVSQLIAFTAQPLPMFSAGWLAWAIAARTLGRAERAVALTGAAYGSALMGAPRIARWLGSHCARRLPREFANDRLSAFGHETIAVQRMSCGQWDELLPYLDRIARAFGDLQCTRHRVENQALAAKLACYLGQLEEAHKRFSAMTDEAHAIAGGMGELWGRLGQVETGMRLGRYSHQQLHALLERARRDMTEIENVDSAYNLRWLGLKTMVAWRSGQIEVARETALIAAAVARRIRFCGFWAHEGFAGPIEVLLRVRAQERQLGGASPVLDQALACLMRAMRAHVRRFPPGAARLHQLRGLAAIDAGHSARAVAALRESVSAAERYGLRYELARSCELLAQIDCKGTWKQRAQRLFSEVGAADDLRRLLDREPAATVVPS